LLSERYSPDFIAQDFSQLAINARRINQYFKSIEHFDNIFPNFNITIQKIPSDISKYESGSIERGILKFMNFMGEAIKNQSDLDSKVSLPHFLIESYSNLVTWSMAWNTTNDKIFKLIEAALSIKRNVIETQADTKLQEYFQSSSRFVEEFIKNEELVEFLKSDIEEAKQAYKQEMYKSTAILCGSLIESLLKESLIKYKEKFPEQVSEDLRTIENYSLINIIEKAKLKGILRSASAELADATRHYRNAIHTFRQAENIGYMNNIMAQAVVVSLKVVCDDILKWYESILSKEQKD
jgi:hypothetical protein